MSDTNSAAQVPNDSASPMAIGGGEALPPSTTNATNATSAALESAASTLSSGGNTSTIPGSWSPF